MEVEPWPDHARPVPETMRAAVLEDFGPPGVHALRNCPVPRPSPGDVLVEVRACGICGEDVLARRGELTHLTKKLPIVQGHELAGRIVSVGSGVNNFSIGDRVVVAQSNPCRHCDYCRSGQELLCTQRYLYGEDRAGGYAEYCLVDSRNAVSIPAGISFETATLAGCAIAVGVRAIALSSLRGGQTVLITGASGGVGIHALQTARAYGLQTIAATSSPEKVGRLSSFADDVVMTGDAMASDLRSRGLQPDAVIELTSGFTFQQSMKAVKRGGRIVVVGNVDPRAVTIHPGALISRELRLQGCGGASHRSVKEALRLLASRSVQPMISSTFSLENLDSAHYATESSIGFGRVVVTHRARPE